MPELYLILSHISKKANIRTLITTAHYFGATIIIAGQRNFDVNKHIPSNLRSDYGLKPISTYGNDLDNSNSTKNQAGIWNAEYTEDDDRFRTSEKVFEEEHNEEDDESCSSLKGNIEHLTSEKLVHIREARDKALLEEDRVTGISSSPSRLKNSSLENDTGKRDDRREKDIPFLTFENMRHCEKWLKEQHIPIVGIEILEGATSIEDFEFASYEKLAILLGNEGDGMSETQLEICRESAGFVFIPQYGSGTCSLNVAIAATIIMHRWHVSLPGQYK